MAQHMKHKKILTITIDDSEDEGEDNVRQQVQIYAKDSMDRFGDDLCALLLFQLSLEDRFRCECVSKQFQRTAFGSVVDITLNDNLISKTQGIPETETYYNITTSNTIDCREMTLPNNLIPEVLAIFRDNCRHLREIYCNLWRNRKQTMGSLGPLITRIGCLNHIDCQSLTQCNRFSDLQSVFVSHLKTTGAENIEHKFQL
ncbi:unnamed protein product [Medioppia subpectinata]|uniref:Uncharacterized protein n=1 Tax=Medioppia subpectinata TaxID=1979941 RepID=A0A7R9KSS4_9ACAR|nr:unnamed protein product [Medioppia subpectinata]CAG2109180.1 unnamed protein product [Medioppia subpectinata]